MTVLTLVRLFYGKLWRGHSGLTAWQKDFLNNFALENFVVVLAQAPRDTLLQRYNARQQAQTIDPSELEKVQNMFKEEMKDARIIQYQSSNPMSLQNVVNQIVTALGVEEDGTTSLKKLQKPKNIKDFILLEGANGSGKSTLAKLLKINMVGWSIKTLDYRDTDHFMRYLQAYSLHKETIFDRGHLSEVVYANLFRNGHSFSEQELYLLDEYTARKGTVLFCNPPLAIIKERVKNATYPKHIREDVLERVVHSFKTLLEVHHIPFLEVDTSDPQAIDNVIQQVRTAYQTLTYQDMKWA
jgi:thymidylate kinase